MRRRGRAVYTRLPFIAAGATLILARSCNCGTKGLSARSWGTVVGTVVIVLLVMIRQTVAMADNAHLLQQPRPQHDVDLRRHGAALPIFGPARLGHHHAHQRHRELWRTSARRWRPVLGESPEQAVGRPAIDVLRPDDRPTVERLVTQLHRRPQRAARRSSCRFAIPTAPADGWKWLRRACSTTPASRASSPNIRDVTEAKLLQDRLRYDASHDSLTGLPNRALLNELCGTVPRITHPAQQTVRRSCCSTWTTSRPSTTSRATTWATSFSFVVADRLRGNVRPTDTVARLGGDEFAVLMTGCPQVRGRIERATHLGALSGKRDHDRGPRARRASEIGVAVGSRRPFDTMLRDADAAMYEAKRNQSGIHLYVGGSSAPKSAVSVSEPDQ